MVSIYCEIELLFVKIKNLDYDKLEAKAYYKNLARFKQQCNKDFKCFVTDQLRPIDHLGIITWASTGSNKNLIN